MHLKQLATFPEEKGRKYHLFIVIFSSDIGSGINKESDHDINLYTFKTIRYWASKEKERGHGFSGQTSCSE
jgi:hypothetical protein